jgi:hypothetical protein
MLNIRGLSLEKLRELEKGGHATKNTTERSITHASEGPAYASATSGSSDFFIRHIFNT